MNINLSVNADIRLKKPLKFDPLYTPTSLFNRWYNKLTNENTQSKPFQIVLKRPSGTISVFNTSILPSSSESTIINRIYIERTLKFLLWQKGGYQIELNGDLQLANEIKAMYQIGAVRTFDNEFLGKKVYLKNFEFIINEKVQNIQSIESLQPLGRHWDGCRIGFDLGGSDRKCAAVQDGKVLFTEEIVWNPYHQADPNYHIEQINDSLKRAAAHLPRVDAIGGSAAGVYVNNEVRAASLFRGISDSDFASKIRPLFKNLKTQWNNIPFDVVNDGEVTALAGSMALQKNSILGVAMGTSQAVGFVDKQGFITDWLNELAFAPMDYQTNAAMDEWSQDQGCGVQYFSQQAVARLLKQTSIKVEPNMTDAEKLKMTQRLSDQGNPEAIAIFETIGNYFGYTVPMYHDFYDFETILVLGRVVSGSAGDIILKTAQNVIKQEFTEVSDKITITTLGETDKRHGQAVAAATLPSL